MRSQAERLLMSMLGPGARFHDGQWEAIQAVVEDRARVLVVQKTGWGKSLIYFLATRLLRDGGAGPTVLISPLLSLMRNQMQMADRIGIRALTMNSGNQTDWENVEAALSRDACDILLVSPERLANERFQTQTLPAIRRGIGLFVVDETHCISDWGHDFRPDYRRVIRIVNNLPPTVPVLATTATANDRVVDDVTEQLGRPTPAQRPRRLPWWLTGQRKVRPPLPLVIQRGPLARPSLRIQVMRLDDQAQRLAWLVQHLPSLPGSGIIYCLTIADCERVAEWLQRHRIDARAYHARLTSDERVALEDQLLRNEVKCLVATVALGMGFDKPDLGFVVHYQRPGSVVAYYQQIGRAGRAVDDAYAILLNGREDDEVQDFFIRSAFPDIEAMRQVLAAIEKHDTIAARTLEPSINLSRRRIAQCLTLLEIDGAIQREGRTYFRTVNPWHPDEDRWSLVTSLRFDELRDMQVFVEHPGCLMEFIARALNDPMAAPCGRCANCAGPVVSASIDTRHVAEAERYLKNAARPIEPQWRWPDRGLFPWNGINLNPRNQRGQVPSIYGDAGWGQLVKTGKYHDGRFSDALVQAAAALVRERWMPQPPPMWVAAVPSLRHPTLLVDFAHRLAASLGLSFLQVLTKTRETPEQKTMANSAQQLKNIADVFSVAIPDVRPGPVLLVDDIVDSGWTLTFCGALLRAAGCGTVYPFALARARSDQ
ncbi:MAG: DEAD/DEAH box helicase [Dehalococcoidia bacterium]